MPDEQPLDRSIPAVRAHFAHDEPPIGRRGILARPPGSYAFYKDFIEWAVTTDAPPSPELIDANANLACWEAYLGVAKVSSFPVSVHLAVTDVCNARCLFCAYAPETSANRSVKLSDIARADWLKFVKRFYPNSALGEPLVHPDIVAILREVRNKAPFIKTGMTTNASLMTPEIVDAIVEHLSVLIVSLNAARKETYEREMAPLKWDRTIDNLRRLMARKRTVGTEKPDVQVSIVLHRHNLEELPELPALLKSIGIGRLRVLVMSLPRPIMSRKLHGVSDLIHHDPENANRIFALTKQQCSEHDIQLVFPLPVIGHRGAPARQ